MKKKLLSLALVLAMALTLLPTAVFAQETEACTEATNHAAPGEAGSQLEKKGEAKAPTCTEAGTVVYFECKTCGWFFAATGEAGSEAPTGNALKTAPTGAPATGHTADETKWYQKDGDTAKHYRKCQTCQTLLDGTNGTTETSAAHSYTEADNKCVCGATNPNAGTGDDGKAKITGASFTINTSDATKGTLSWTYTPATGAQGNPTFTITCPQSPAGFSAATAAAGSNNAWTSAITLPANLDDGDYTFKIEDNSTPKVSATAKYTKGTSTPAAKVGTITSILLNLDGTVTFTYAPAEGETNVPPTIVCGYNVGTSYNADTKVELTVSSGTLSGDVYTYKTTQALPGYGTYTLNFFIGQTRLTSSESPVTWSAPASSGGSSSGTVTVPDSSNVTGADSAAEAIKNVQNMSSSSVASSLETALSTGVTSSGSSTAAKPTEAEVKAAQKVLNDLADLDKTVQKEAGITVSVVAKSAAIGGLDVGGVSIDNAALNAKETKNTQIELQISAPEKVHGLPGNYNPSSAVAFSMTMTNVVSTTRLAVPVVITLPVPAGMNPSRVVVLHYHDGDTPAVIYPSVSGSKVSFVLTGFSDFILTEAMSSSNQGSAATGSGGHRGSGSANTPGKPSTPSTPSVPSTPAGVFTDVPANHSFAAQITWARDNSVMGGYADGSFRPNNTTNRQQLWMVLGRLADANPADMAAAREWAVSAGISDGSNPQGAMSRQQLVTMLYRFAQSQGKSLEGAADLSTYPDSGSVASYAQEALAWAVGNGIVTGTTDGRLNPEGTASRAHFAVFLYRFSQMG